MHSRRISSAAGTVPYRTVSHVPPPSAKSAQTSNLLDHPCCPSILPHHSHPVKTCKPVLLLTSYYTLLGRDFLQSDGPFTVNSLFALRCCSIR